MRCLVVDDEPVVRRAIVRMLEAQGFTCLEAGSGREALELMAEAGELPLIVSDLRMPELDGMGLLSEVRRLSPDTAVVMLSGMAETSVAVECLHLGAADFLVKPVAVSEMHARVARALEKRTLVMQNRYYQANLERQVQEQAERIRELFLEGVQMLARALEAKDAYLRGHSVRVSRYAAGTARRLGLDDSAIEQIRLGGELHDIGKIGTREAVLLKPGLLTDDERHQICEHPVLGERMLAPLARESPGVLRVVRSHHERLDGSGFPDHLLGDTIPLEARIVAVADAFDAMTSERPYRAPRTPVDALNELNHVAGSQLDPDVVEAFVAAFPDPAALPITD
jgi:response regulator RpfG family c-di-GMP phosphodiesterase